MKFLIMSKNSSERCFPIKAGSSFHQAVILSIDTSWETIKHFRDAWLEFREMK